MKDQLIELNHQPPIIRLQPDRAEAALELAATRHPQSLSPLPERRTRNGKIARLPRPERDMVNRMLFNNIPLQRIVGALDEVGITVTERNISNWKTRGGYREWCLAQNHAIQTQLHQDHLTALLRKENASELPEVGLQAASIQLSQFFLTPEAAQLLASNPKEYDRRLAMLGKVAVQLNALQKYRDDCAKELGPRHNPERIRRDAEKDLENVRKTFSSTISEGPNIPNTPHRNFLPVL